MIFQDRRDAGQKLSALLSAYKNKKNTVVLGLARGGIVVARQIANALSLPLNVVVPRKLGAPDNPELAIGAIAEDGEAWLNSDIIAYVNASPAFIQQQIKKEKQVAEERLAKYRHAVAAENLHNKTVILVDDGVATGATLFAEIRSMRKQHVARIVVACPVAAKDAWQAIQATVDEAICLDIQEHFLGISSFYRDFGQVDDETVVHLLLE